MFAEPDTEVELDPHEARDHGPGDDGVLFPNWPSSMTTRPSPIMENEVQTVAVTASRSPRIGSEVMCVTSSGAAPRVIVKLPPVSREKRQLLS